MSNLIVKRARNMDKIKLKHAQFNEQPFERLIVIVDDEHNVILLPLLYSVHLEQTGTTFHYKQRKVDGKDIIELSESDIGDGTIDTTLSHVYKFYQYLNDLSLRVEGISVQQVYKCDSYFINDYLNDYLVESGIKSLSGHKSSLSGYFNFLSRIGICNSLELSIDRKSKQRAAELDEKPNVIKYVSRDHRQLLLLACKSKAERLILRMGFEVGLRTSENVGLLLHKNNEAEKNVEKAENRGLQALFDDLDSDIKEEKNEFKYWLQGKYAKNGRPRMLYFKRELLVALKDYAETDRKDLLDTMGYKHEHLFVRSDNGCEGLPIATWHGSNIFKSRKINIPGLDQNLSYHSLRHTFATELFYECLLDKDGRENRAESSALITVARRLGHKLDKKEGKAPSTTNIYVELLEDMKKIEGIAA